MNSSWPTVKLGEVLGQRKEFLRIDDFATYKRCRVQLHAQGIVLRDQVLGSEVKTKTQQVCRAGEFLVAEIDAKVGGFGIVPPELDGAIVSGHYFLFEVHETQLDRRFLGYFAKTPGFAEQVKAQGSTNYAAIRPSHILAYDIPLPPLEEQRRIVTKLDAVSEKIGKARICRAEGDEGESRVLIAMAHRADLGTDAKARLGWQRVRLGEVITQVADEHVVDTAGTYPNVGIYSYARGLFAKPPIGGLATSAVKLNRVHTGQFIYSRLFAFEGAYAKVEAEFDGCFVSNEYPTFECDRSKATPEFVAAYFRAPAVWSKVAAGSKGLGHRRQRVQPGQLLSHELYLPPLAWQERIAGVMAKVHSLDEEARKAGEDLGGLMLAILDRAFRGDL